MVTRAHPPALAEKSAQIADFRANAERSEGVVEGGFVGGGVGAVELVELGDDGVDVGLGARDPLAADLHELAGPADPLGQAVAS